jgi:hypothetical protein
MKQAHCYWPSWSTNGKLLKKGSYCNWESVVAHAAYQLQKGLVSQSEHDKIIEHVEQIAGTVVEKAPHYEELSHTRGTMTASVFHEACVFQKHPITGVKISSDGDVFEVILHPDTTSHHTGRFIFAHYLHKPYSYHGAPSTFHSMRKKTAKSSERDLSVWYYPVKDLPHNAYASNLFKMQLYGDVLLVQQSREQCFLPRDRFISFTKAHFDEQFCKKRKRQDVQCMSFTGYAEVKERMQSALNEFEANAAKTAVPPRELASAQSVVPIDGRSLAKKVKTRVELHSNAPPAVLAAMAPGP